MILSKDLVKSNEDFHWLKIEVGSCKSVTMPMVASDYRFVANML